MGVNIGAISYTFMKQIMQFISALSILMPFFMLWLWRDVKKVRERGVDVKPGSFVSRHVLYSFILALILFSVVSLTIEDGFGFLVLMGSIGEGAWALFSGEPSVFLDAAAIIAPYVYIFFLLIYWLYKLKWRQGAEVGLSPLSKLPEMEKIKFVAWGILIMLVAGWSAMNFMQLIPY